MRGALLLCAVLVLGVSLSGYLFSYLKASVEEIQFESVSEALSFAAEPDVHGSDWYLQASRRVYEMSGRASSSQDQVRLLCKSLSLFGQAVSADPLSSSKLMGWATQRAILGPMECPDPLTKGEVASVVRFAIEQDSNKPERYLTAARIFRYLGEKKESLEYLRVYLRKLLPGAPKGTHKDSLLAELDTPTVFLEVVPTSIFTVNWWSELLRKRARSLPEWEEALVQFQRQVVEQEAKREGLSNPKLIEQVNVALYTLALQTENDRIRQAIDLLLAERYREFNRTELSEFFTTRATFSALPLATSFEPGDLAPTRSPIARWSREQALTFDRYYATVGFFSSLGVEPQMVQLTTTRHSERSLLPSFIRVFVSEDNHVFGDVTSKFRIDTLRAPRGSILRISPIKPVTARYWKIHFANGARQGMFTAEEMSRLLKVFGNDGRQR